MPRNALQFAGAAVVFERGGIPLVEKVQRAADAGAVAAVIIDDALLRCGGGGSADEGAAASAYANAENSGALAATDQPAFSDRCTPGCSDTRGEGWGCRDDAVLWSTADIPAVMMTRRDGLRLLQATGLPSPA
jgi:hypothetical protein